MLSTSWGSKRDEREGSPAGSWKDISPGEIVMYKRGDAEGFLPLPWGRQLGERGVSQDRAGGPAGGRAGKAERKQCRHRHQGAQQVLGVDAVTVGTSWLH